MLIQIIEGVYRLLWGDLLTLHLGNVTLSLSFMVILLLTAGVFFTLRTRLLPVRLFRDMLAAVCEKNDKGSGLSSFQTLVVSTATRVGMGNLVGVVAALSVGGAGAVFWMWVTALLGASTSFVESTLAQKYKQPDHLYGGWRGGPAYYLHTLAERKRGRKLRRSVAACLFAVSGLICWCGISQVVSNSVSEAFQNAFSIPPLVTTLVLTALAAVIVLRKEATVKSLDVMVPIMAGCYFVMTLWIILTHLPQLPDVFVRIFSEALGLRQAVGGGFGAVVMNGIKRGLFSNEAGSGSAPCAAAAAECDDPVKMGLVQALGVLIDTIVICSCTAFVMLLAPGSVTSGLQGMNLLQAAMQYHLGSFGVVFIAVTLALFSFSTFIGILYYARCNVAYLFGDSWFWQTAYKVLALVMLDAVEEKFGDLLPGLKWLNFGGGHHITRPGYDLAALEACIARMQEKYGVQVYLEPGEAWALNAGYLVTTVLDTLQNGDTSLAILDMSAACHTPDVIEMPYRPPLLDAGEPGEKPCTIRLGGPTCLAGDVVGDYSFDAPLAEGDRLIFGDMAIYTTCKNNTFNGMPLPPIWALAEDGTCRELVRFGYNDFKMRLGHRA